MFAFSLFILILQPLDYNAIVKSYGLVGLAFVIALVGVAAAFRWGKKFLEDTLKDARQERDYSKNKMEEQGKAFLNALAEQGELHRKGYEDIVHELRGTSRKR